MTKPVLRLPANTQGRDFVVGDIHGIFDVLEAALASVAFNPAVDRLICVGDLIDRGHQSDRVLDYLAKPWFFSLRGNHEQMFLYAMRDGTLDLDVVRRNLVNGFGWMLEQPHEKLLAIAYAFLQLPYAIEIEAASGKPEDRIGFVHADVPTGIDWDIFTGLLEQHNPTAVQYAQWSRVRIENGDTSGVAGIARVFLGHTPLAKAAQLGNCFFIDTGGVFRIVNAPRDQHLFLSLVETTAAADDITQWPDIATDFRVATKGRSTPTLIPPKPKPPRP